MPSYYVVRPFGNAWCNDRPQVVSGSDCLVLVPKYDGSGSCLYSDSCDKPYGAICEGVYFKLS
jgi:hypothetical protein